MRGHVFQRDFFRVAADEARHLGWCLDRLEELGYEYGCLASHNLLWEGSESTSSDVLDRLVVVPCVQEARGLDAGPRLVKRLIGCGDTRSSEIVGRITEEELPHVAVGTYWLRRLVHAAEPTGSFSQLNDAVRRRFGDAVRRHVPDIFKGKATFNVGARTKAGLLPSWYDDRTDSEDRHQLERRLNHLIESETNMTGPDAGEGEAC